MQPTNYKPTVTTVFAAPSAPPAPAQAPATNVDPSQFGNYSDWAAQELKNGATPEQLHQTLTDNGINVGGGGGNWFTHLLPTIGGIAGGALGSLTDIFDGPLGTIGGSAGGSALGKSLENALEGKKVIQGDDLTAGLEGAVGQGAGLVAGKALGALGGALVNKGTDAAAQVAAKDTTGAIANAYGDVPKPLQSLYNADSSLSHVKSVGLDPANPQNLVDVGNNSNDVLNEALNGALAKSGPVNLGNYNDIVRGSLAQADPNGGLLGSIEGIPLARGGYGAPNTTAAKLVGQLQDMGAGVAKANSDPNELRTLVDNLNGLSQKLAPKVNPTTGTIDPASEAAYNLVNNVKGQVSSALYDRPEVNAALQGSEGNIAAADVGGSQQLADHINNLLTTAGANGNSAAQDILSEIGRNNDITALGNEGLKAGQIVTSPTAQARAVAQATGNNAPSATSSVLNGAQAGHSLLAGVASHGIVPAVMGVAKAGSHIASDPRLVSTLGRITQVLGRGAPAAGVAMGTAANLGAAPVDQQPGTLNTGGNMNGSQGAAFNGGNNGSILGNILNTYMGMGAIDPYVLSSTAPVVQALAPQVQKQELAANALGALPASYANAGGAQGLGGILSQISGLIPGTAANTYERQRAAAAQALGGSMGVSPAAASGLLPGLMQNQNSAGISSSILGQLSGQLLY